MNKIPNSQMARAGVVGTTAMKLGVGKIKNKAKRPFLSAEKRKDAQQSQEDQDAEILFNAITKLRGTAVKLAQMMGMETDLLPDRIQKELSKSYHQVPPLNRVLVQKVILAEFGKNTDQLFEKFDTVAMAAASLGQVHRAEIGKGTSVAVKVQYPGINVTIESDLKLLRKFTSNGVRLLPKHKQPKKQIIDASIDEIGLRLMEETNYQLEAESTRWFHENLGIAGVEVPKVFDEFCTGRVITTQLVEGLHIDDWLRTNPSQALRDKAAQLIYDLFIHSTVELGRVHADPNPGNYLFKKNGELALIDFGCVKKLSKHFTQQLPPLLHAFYLDDVDKIIQAYADIGMHLSPELPANYEQVLRPFGEWLSKPIREPYFDFKEHNDYTSSGLSVIKGLSESPFLETVESHHVRVVQNI